MQTEQQGGAHEDGVQNENANPEQEKQEEEQQEEQKPSINPDDHKRAIDDMHKYKSKTRELEQKLEEIEQTRLKEKEDYKTLWEREKERAEKAFQERESLQSAFENNEKFNALKSQLLKQGLRQEAEQDLDLLELDSLQLEKTSHGRVLVHGTEAYAEQIKKLRPHWFKDTQVPKFNSGGATNSRVSDEELTPQKVIELERKYLREGKKEKVAELYKRYQQQKQKR